MIDKVHDLISQGECEWIEFKKDYAKPEEIGKYISALSNSALLMRKDEAYMLWGVDDQSHHVIGTKLTLKKQKVGNEDLANWLLQRLKPRIHFTFQDTCVDGRTVAVLKINAATNYPVSFENMEYIRIGASTRKLRDYPEKERMLWQMLENIPFENKPAKINLSKEQVLDLLDFSAYFNLIQSPIPDGHDAIIQKFIAEELIEKSELQENHNSLYNITHLGAVLFAKKLNDFQTISRKSVRIVHYKGKNKQKVRKEYQGYKGYAVGFERLIDFIMDLVPEEEILESPIRKTKTMFPEVAVRELVANALIHQDFCEAGSRVMIELFEDRLEISNPGSPLVDPKRFLDAPPKSRNEKLSSLLRRLGICEERGSGIDKVIHQIEIDQLPAPLFEKVEHSTRVVLFARREFKNLTKKDRVRACYHHASLKYIERDYMTNASLRKRFGISDKSVALVSRIINDAIQSGEIYIYDEHAGNKSRKYIPDWAKS